MLLFFLERQFGNECDQEFEGMLSCEHEPQHTSEEFRQVTTKFRQVEKKQIDGKGETSRDNVTWQCLTTATPLFMCL